MRVCHDNEFQIRGRQEGSIEHGLTFHTAGVVQFAARRVWPRDIAALNIDRRTVLDVCSVLGYDLL
jgi:hypothetical protein